MIAKAEVVQLGRKQNPADALRTWLSTDHAKLSMEELDGLLALLTERKGQAEQHAVAVNGKLLLSFLQHCMYAQPCPSSQPNVPETSPHLDTRNECQNRCRNACSLLGCESVAKQSASKTFDGIVCNTADRPQPAHPCASGHFGKFLGGTFSLIFAWQCSCSATV